ncbi:MAG: SulP family inorganic anion transporter [Prosthecobacter sp.]|nr:SulP family inorganic anion transporter [Prosthecobacter sp.]
MREWLPGYRRAWLVADSRGGFDGALLAIPQGMAFAAVAGLPLAYGITCSAVACTVGAFFMSSRHSIYGPTNATAFMVASYFATYPQIDQLGAMPNLVFIVGMILVLGALLRIADLGQYVSRTVIIAYLTGAAVQMLVHQLPVVLGITLTPIEGVSGHPAPQTLVGDLWQTLAQLPQASWLSILVSVITFLAYLGIRRWRSRWPAMALTICLLAGLAKLASLWGLSIVTYADARFGLGDLLPAFPDFTTREATGQFSRLFGLAMALAFMAMLENSSMARTLAAQKGHRIDANQDLFSLGVANLACSYLSGMPASHSLTRSMANYASGAVTPVSAIVSGVICLIGALTIGPMVAYMPKATLATLVMCVAAGLINPKHIRVAMRATRSDAAVFLITLGASLMVPLHVAIFTGVGVSLVLYLHKASRPSLVEYEFNQEGHLAEATQPGVRQNPAVSIVHVEGELFFGAADLFRTQIQVICADANLRIIILRLKNARHMDATSILALEELIHVLRADGRDLIISGVMKDVYRVLRDSGMVDIIGKDNIFPASPSNPNVATRNALKRAQQILGTSEAEVRIYFDPNKKKDAAVS